MMDLADSLDSHAAGWTELCGNPGLGIGEMLHFPRPMPVTSRLVPFLP
jgi:hypothetical protein